VDTRSSQIGSANAFYEAAYREQPSAPRGISYEETAAQAAKDYDIDGQVRAALRAHGVKPTGESTSFDHSLVSAGAGEGWREDADPRSLELWDRLRALVTEAGGASPAV